VEVVVRKAIFLFLALFITWQVLYYVNLIVNGLDWLLAYLVVLAVAICFYILDKQKANDLGLVRSRLWGRYVIIALMFAVGYVLYWAVLGALIFSTGPISIIPHGPFSIPYAALEALVIGLVEETAFRGYILRNLKKVYSSTKAIAYSSLLFGLYHLSLAYIPAQLSVMSWEQTFAYWALFVLAALVIGLFLGYFYVNAGQTTIVNITYHSSSIFLEVLVPYGLAIPSFNAHLFSTSFYIAALPLLFLLKRGGWLAQR
jgi:membrane protease YdiL (CAAX protease family)